MDVWPEGKMPPPGAREPEAEKPSKDTFHRITNVSRPTLSLYSAKKEAPTPAIIVCPGGGYSYVVIDKEGSEIAAWLNSNGISALVHCTREAQAWPQAALEWLRAIGVR